MALAGRKLKDRKTAATIGAVLQGEDFTRGAAPARGQSA